MKLPPILLAQLSKIKTELVVIAGTKIIKSTEIADGTYAHLDLPAVTGEISIKIPSPEIGDFSRKNVEGWTVVRKYLPKISKTFSWETPNFGDGSRFGYHLHSRVREVYQQEIFEPRGYSIVSEKIRDNGTGGDHLYKFSIEQMIDTSSQFFMSELLFAVNLLQENTGTSGIFPSDASRSDFIATQLLDWEVFPPGTAEEVTSALLRGKSTTEAARLVIADRVKLFSKLHPKKYLRGSGGFGAYIGALFANDLVVFENVNYGNALYMLYDGWEDVSKRSRLDLLRGTDANFDRFPHISGWDVAFAKKLKSERRKRGL